jgi:hypothetical protein
MKLDIKFWTKFQKWIRIISGFLFSIFILVLYADAKIILRNNYEETNNNLYLILNDQVVLRFVLNLRTGNLMILNP